MALSWRIENSNVDSPIFQRMNDNRAGGCAANSDITYLRGIPHSACSVSLHLQKTAWVRCTTGGTWRLSLCRLKLIGQLIPGYLLSTILPAVITLITLVSVPGSALVAAMFFHQTPGAGVYLALVLIFARLGLVMTPRSSSTLASTLASGV